MEKWEVLRIPPECLLQHLEQEIWARDQLGAAACCCSLGTATCCWGCPGPSSSLLLLPGSCQQAIFFLTFKNQAGFSDGEPKHSVCPAGTCLFAGVVTGPGTAYRKLGGSCHPKTAGRLYAWLSSALPDIQQRLTGPQED